MIVSDGFFIIICVACETLTPLRFFQNHSLGNISFRIECLNIIRPIYYEYVLGIIMESGMLVILSIYTLYFSKITYSLMIGIGIGVVCIMLILMTRLVRLNYSVVKEENSYRSYYSEIVGVMDTVKLFNLDSEILSEWKEQFSNVNRVIIKREKLQNLYSSIEISLNIVAPLLIVAINMRRKNDFGKNNGIIYSCINLFSKYNYDIEIYFEY